MVTQWYPLDRWYALDAVELVANVSDTEKPWADSEPRVRRGASRRVLEFIRGTAVVAAVRRARA